MMTRLPPPPKQQQTRKTRSRQALADALLSLLEEKPFDKITIREIAARADVGYATFFRHYEDQEALLSDLVSSEISRLLVMIVPIVFTVDTLSSAQALCAYLWEHRPLWTALLTGGASTKLKNEFVTQVQQEAAKRAYLHSWLPGDLNVVFAASATLEILTWWLKQDDPPPVKQMAEVLDRLVITPATDFAEDNKIIKRSPR